MVGNTGRHTRIHAHILRQTPRIIVHVYFVCALIFSSLRCDADNATYAQRVANTMRADAASAASHTPLISFMHKRCQLCLQMQQSRRAAFLFVCAAQFFSRVVWEGVSGRGGHKALPVSELSLTAHSGIHTHTQARMHAHVASAMG